MNSTIVDWAISLGAWNWFILAAILAYAAGSYSLSRQYVLPTFLTLGLASAYIQLASRRLPAQYRVSRAWVGRLVTLSVIGFLALRLMTQILGWLGV